MDLIIGPKLYTSHSMNIRLNTRIDRCIMPTKFENVTLENKF
ncbi:uncharacterized protein METZ01_LOCUS30147 [marine metagenome]|uniref:Uncharacterized protein n=1 Tax=marine metagenome TaxID=408172 RepID=A0A381QI19_9ZZZZ